MLIFLILASHLVWVRGLKRTCRQEKSLHGKSVAPRVGAWIETSYDIDRIVIDRLTQVAPRVGAWIETYWCN